MANGTKKRGIIKYKSYSFIDKDPLIDVMRTAVDDSKKSYTEISEGTNVSSSTMYNWFHGKTKRPQFATATAVILHLGKKGIMFRGGKPYLVD